MLCVTVLLLFEEGEENCNVEQVLSRSVVLMLGKWYGCNSSLLQSVVFLEDLVDSLLLRVSLPVLVSCSKVWSNL